MAIAFAPLHPLFAAEVTGMNVAEPLAHDDKKTLIEAIDRYSVLVFRDQTLTDDLQIAFAANFGPLETSTRRHRLDNLHRVERAEIADVSNLDENGRPRAAGDRERMNNLGNQLWHTDSSFKKIPGHLSMLYAHSVPSWGGETEFADLRAAWDALPDRLKRKIETLHAEHALMHSRASIGFTDFTKEERDALPPVIRPLMRTHPGSGRKTLYLASHAAHIIELPVPEGRMLLRELIEHATQRQFVYTHAWRRHDMVLWDNRCTMHRGRPYDETEPRDVRRVTTADVDNALEKAA